jgi:predicted ATPase
MTNETSRKRSQTHAQAEAIAEVSVAGYKSIVTDQTLEIRPLTVLAGANSSGKSSIIQPLLLLKQTLEETFDPGPILLNGAHLKFSSADEFLSHSIQTGSLKVFSVRVKLTSGDSLTIEYAKQHDKDLAVKVMTYTENGREITFTPDMTHDDILPELAQSLKEFRERMQKDLEHTLEWRVTRRRCFLGLQLVSLTERSPTFPTPVFVPTGHFESHIQKIIHLPGLRGNPERAYPVTAVGPRYPGTFQPYVASIITNWQAKKNKEKLSALSKDLEYLGLTWKVTAKQIDDTRVRLRVGRLMHPVRGGARDLVDISDVGFGLSQSLPVAVALHAAEPGQLVYLEQPEIHLHPKAQYRLATLLANAVGRDVRVVVETHSAVLLLGIQTAVAERKLAPSKVKLNWFERNEKGETKMTPAELDESGAFGDWPEDFAEVEIEGERKYLDAAELRQAGH